MSEDLTVTLIQSDLVWEKIAENLDRFQLKIESISKETDLIILPEMFATGFSMNPKQFAEIPEGKIHDWMKSMANKANAVITGSIIVKEESKYYNRLIWMNPDGSYQKYDKRHLFTFAGEDKHYDAGNKELTVDLKGWKIKTLICYDLRFPVWSRNINNYDILLYVANWPHRRSDAWKTLLKARAIENQSFVVAVNRVGNDNNYVEFSGDSVILSPKGEKISNIKPFEECIETVTLSKREILGFREKFNVLADADKFNLT